MGKIEKAPPLNRIFKLQILGWVWFYLCYVDDLMFVYSFPL